MDDLEKLQKLIPHFVEHGLEHAKTYDQWADRLDAAEKPAEAALFRKAAASCAEAARLIGGVRF